MNWRYSDKASSVSSVVSVAQYNFMQLVVFLEVRRDIALPTCSCSRIVPPTVDADDLRRKRSSMQSQLVRGVSELPSAGDFRR